MKDGDKHDSVENAQGRQVLVDQTPIQLECFHLYRLSAIVLTSRGCCDQSRVSRSENKSRRLGENETVARKTELSPFKRWKHKASRSNAHQSPSILYTGHKNSRACVHHWVLQNWLVWDVRHDRPCRKTPSTVVCVQPSVGDPICILSHS